MGDVITGALGERLDSQMMDDSLSQSSVFSELKDARTGGEERAADVKIGAGLSVIGSLLRGAFNTFECGSASIY